MKTTPSPHSSGLDPYIFRQTGSISSTSASSRADDHRASVDDDADAVEMRGAGNAPPVLNP